MKEFLKKYWPVLFAFLLGAYSGRRDFENIQTAVKSGMDLFDNGVHWVSYWIEQDSKKRRK